jgi:hypothetical protein
MKDKDRIKELEQQLKEAKEYTYVHEITAMYCADGELHLEYGNSEDWKWVVLNVDALYNDLPMIIEQVITEQRNNQIMILDEIKESIKQL